MTANDGRLLRESDPWRNVAAAAGLLGADGQQRDTIFTEMSALASRSGAVNLGQGFPDEDGPDDVLAAAKRAIDEGFNQYAPGRGYPALLQAIAAHQHQWYAIDYDPAAEILVTTGATEALAAAILALVRPGDEVVVFEPYYDAYAGLIGLAGGTLVPVPLRWPTFQPDLDEFRAAVTERTRLILVNDPHNPTGAVFDAAVRTAVVDAARAADAVIVTDEVYEHLVFDGAVHRPIAAEPGARERTISISSGGKTFNATGWKVGWACGPAELIDAVLAVKQFLTFVSSGPFQLGIARGLGLPASYFRGVAADMQAKRDILVGALRELDVPVAVPAATYYAIADVADLGWDDSVAFCKNLTQRVGVAAIPVSAFVSDAHRGEFSTLVRFAYCKRPATLHGATDRLRRGLRSR